MYKKLAIFTSLVIFYYTVFTIFVRPIAKHSFVLRAAKRLYYLNQEISDEQLKPELLKPPKGQAPQKNNSQVSNKNKKRGDNSPRKGNRANDYRQDDESFEDTPNEHHR